MLLAIWSTGCKSPIKPFCKCLITHLAVMVWRRRFLEFSFFVEITGEFNS